MRLNLKNTKGVTLIELMVTVAIVGILAVIVIPSYLSSIEKTRRGDCKAALLNTAQRLERCMTMYGAYNSANCPTVAGVPIDSDEGHYQINVATTATTFTATCAAAVDSTQEDDVQCAALWLTHTGAQRAADSNGVDTSALCW